MAGFCHKLYELNLMRVPSGRENEMNPAKVFVEKMYIN
jgi:hypothetical protein